MPFVQADVKALEVVSCAYLSGDPVLRKEVMDGVDFHLENQKRFGLPDRLTAKRFKFKLIYGATAYGYAKDPDFAGVSKNPRFWERVIEEYYDKYRGVRAWHDRLVDEVLKTGAWTSPSGRTYRFPPAEVAAKLWYWRPKILNYPVQGFGADLVMIARISAFRRAMAYPASEVKPVTSVHDSIVFDTSEKLCYNIGKMMRDSVRDVPKNFEKLFFGNKFDLPLDAEIKIGPTLGDMQSVHYD